MTRLAGAARFAARFSRFLLGDGSGNFQPLTQSDSENRLPGTSARGFEGEIWSEESRESRRLRLQSASNSSHGLTGHMPKVA